MQAWINTVFTRRQTSWINTMFTLKQTSCHRFIWWVGVGDLYATCSPKGGLRARMSELVSERERDRAFVEPGL